MTIKNSFTCSLVLFLAAGVAGEIAAQDFTTIRDFYGEINDAEHPAGYREYVEMGCYQCHGFQGQGADNMALVPNLMPYEGFAHQVRIPRGVMPAYSTNVLTDEKLRRIYRYLENVPPPPEVSEIPLLSNN